MYRVGCDAIPHAGGGEDGHLPGRRGSQTGFAKQAVGLSRHSIKSLYFAHGVILQPLDDCAGWNGVCLSFDSMMRVFGAKPLDRDRSVPLDWSDTGFSWTPWSAPWIRPHGIGHRLHRIHLRRTVRVLASIRRIRSALLFIHRVSRHAKHAPVILLIWR